jgi:hypothetical protein
MDNKLIMSMVKAHSSIKISLVTNEKDDFLIHVLRERVKTGEVISDVMIIRPDLERRIIRLMQEGFMDASDTISEG